jgi:hypothetical protein
LWKDATRLAEPVNFLIITDRISRAAELIALEVCCRSANSPPRVFRDRSQRLEFGYVFAVKKRIAAERTPLRYGDTRDRVLCLVNKSESKRSSPYEE